MPRKTNINYMMRLVKKFIDDPEASRYVFEDMVYLELEKRYRLMASEDREYSASLKPSIIASKMLTSPMTSCAISSGS